MGDGGNRNDRWGDMYSVRNQRSAVNPNHGGGTWGLPDTHHKDGPTGYREYPGGLIHDNPGGFARRPRTDFPEDPSIQFRHQFGQWTREPWVLGPNGQYTPNPDAMPDIYDTFRDNWKRQTGLLNQLSGQASSMMSGANAFADLLKQSYGRFNDLADGKLSDTFRQEWVKGNKRALDETIGSEINSMASTGVLGSSQANRALGRITSEASDAASRNFLGGINAASGALQGGVGAAGTGLNGLTQAGLASGQLLGQAAQSAMMPFQTQMQAMNSMMSAGDNMLQPAMNLYELWRNTRYSLPSDTVASKEPGLMDFMGAMSPMMLK